MIRRGLSTQYRVMLAGLLPLLLLASLLLAYLVSTRLDVSHAGFAQQGRAYAKEIAALSRYGLFIADTALLKQEASRFLGTEHLYSITVFSTEGKQLLAVQAQRYAHVTQTSLQQFTATVDLLTAPVALLDDLHLDEAYDIDAMPSSLGEVRVDLTSADIEAVNRQIVINSLLIVLIALVIAMMLLWLVSRYITKPIETITRLVKQAESGDFGARIKAQSSGELGVLEIGINAMMASLASHQDELVEEVETATEALYLRNAELEKARHEALQASHAMSQFVAHMSHEIRTPMSGIIGVLGLLNQSSLDQQQRAQVAMVRDSADGLLDVINQILDFSKLEAGKIELRNEPVSLPQLLDSVCQVVKPMADDKNILLSVSLSDQVPVVVMSDQLRLRQVISNLVSNAIKYTEYGSVSIDVDAVDLGDAIFELTILVSDSGIGIDENEMPHLFEAFTQANIANRSFYQGTGLGLAIVRHLLDAMHGAIVVTSQIGQGSCFEVLIRLPCGDLAESSKPAVVHEITHSLHDVHVLVVDDNKVNRYFLERLLTSYGALVTTANDGITAVRMASQRQFDIILMDIHMPRMNGIEASHHIRKIADYQLVPIFALSADAVSRDEVCHATSVFDQFVTKPIDEELLYKSMQIALQSSRSCHSGGEEMLNGKPVALMAELQKLFCDDLIARVSLIAEALEQDAWEDAASQLHYLKGGAGVCGADALYEAICSLQEMLAQGDSSTMRPAVDRLFNAARKLSDASL